jgi:hypothetical protein
MEFMPEVLSEARIYVGADRSQLLAVKVLEYSIARRTDLKISVRSMHDLNLPDPKDIRQGKRTGFSFTRFAIPALAGYRGRALYLDADMLVLRDLRELFELPFGAARVLIQEELQGQVQHKAKRGAPNKRIKQCSVMLLDCSALNWDAAEIIAGLDGRYSYEELMHDLCILAPNEIAYPIPFAWNSLEFYEPRVTGLIHYTDMTTQPWVYSANANGWLWINEVRDMLADGSLTPDDLREEAAQGYVRPSLLAELEAPRLQHAPDRPVIDRYRAIDAAAGFAPHAKVLAQQRRRAEARDPADDERWVSRGKRTIRRLIHKIVE